MNIFSLLGACLVACCSSVGSNNLHLDHKRNAYNDRTDEHINLTYTFTDDDRFNSFVNGLSSTRSYYSCVHYYLEDDDSFSMTSATTMVNIPTYLTSLWDNTDLEISFGVVDLFSATTNNLIWERAYLVGNHFNYTNFIVKLSGTGLFTNSLEVSYDVCPFIYLDYDGAYVEDTSYYSSTLKTYFANQYFFNNFWSSSYFERMRYQAFNSLYFQKTFTGNYLSTVDLDFVNYAQLNFIESDNLNDVYDAGYSNGYYSGKNAGYSTGYDAGYDVGYDAGENYGYDVGWDTGHRVGYNEGLNITDYQFIDLFGAVADTPVLMIRSLFNFDFFGINLLTVVLSLFTGLIVFYLLRKLL